jgi:hypothetical protein
MYSMGTVLIAKWVGDVYTRGLYDEIIRMKGYPYLEMGFEYIGSDTVDKIMTPVASIKFITETGYTVRSLGELAYTESY